jgi:hypothetical protein
MTLREGDREYFYKKLDEHFPGMKQQYQRKYGNSYQVMSDNDHELSQEFYDTCAQHTIVCNNDELFKYMHEFEDKKPEAQLDLFGGGLIWSDCTGPA